MHMKLVASSCMYIVLRYICLCEFSVSYGNTVLTMIKYMTISLDIPFHLHMLFSGPCSDEQRREWMESLMEQKFQVEEEDTTLKLGMDYITQYPN